MKKRFVHTKHAKTAFYKKILTDIRKSKVCPFCPKTFTWHTNPILKQSNGWLVTKSFQSYKNSAHHFIVVGKRHVEHISKLSKKDWSAILLLIQWATKKYALKGGGFALRFGDAKHTGASVLHLHGHLIVPKIKRGHAAPVWFPFG